MAEGEHMQFERLQDGEDGGSYVVEALGCDAMRWVEVGAGSWELACASVRVPLL
jgi:hypothetical protein